MSNIPSKQDLLSILCQIYGHDSILYLEDLIYCVFEEYDYDTLSNRSKLIIAELVNHILVSCKWPSYDEVSSVLLGKENDYGR